MPIGVVRAPRVTGLYVYRTTFHEPFVLFGYLAAVAPIELVAGIVILPQRPAVLGAKQAAEVDILTHGKFCLGMGRGWDAVAYEALGHDFSNRGRPIGEQVQLLRRRWTEDSVTHEGAFERVTGAGRDPGKIGMEARVPGGDDCAEAIARQAARGAARAQPTWRSIPSIRAW